MRNCSGIEFLGPAEAASAAGRLGDLGHPILRHARRPLLRAGQGIGGPRRWDEPTVAEIERQRRAALDLARLPERQIWRDKRLAMLVKAKRQAEQALGE